MSNIKLFTIGFTKKNAESFFTKLKNAGVKKIIDIRLNNVSQLAGFAKKDDLLYFLNFFFLISSESTIDAPINIIRSNPGIKGAPPEGAGGRAPHDING